jgi:hypothetical protein
MPDTTSPNDWKNDASCIPLFKGAHVHGGGFCVSAPVGADNADAVVLSVTDDEHSLALEYADNEGLPIVDLASPDTFAAMRDRVALAAGASPRLIRGGTTFYRQSEHDGKALWELKIHPCGARYMLLVDDLGASRERALALMRHFVVTHPDEWKDTLAVFEAQDTGP